MTLKQIHAMLEPGTSWQASNTKIATANGPRLILERLTTQITYSSERGSQSWTTLPKASEVIEARDGYLRFHSPGSVDWVVTLERIGPHECFSDARTWQDGKRHCQRCWKPIDIAA